MNVLSEYEIFANNLLVKHNLKDWKFVWNNKTSNGTWGICKYNPKEIHINKKFASIESKDCVFDTIIHEIAHALTKGDGHGLVWKKKCVELGCSGEQFKNLKEESMNKLAKYKAVCPTCGHVVFSGKKTGIIHTQCSNEDFRKTGNSNWKNHMYIWSKNN